MPLKLNGSTSGYVIVDAPAIAGTNTLTLPAVTDTITTNTATQTLTNKTLSSPTFTGTSSSDISTSGTVVMGSPFTMRNKIINGAMVIDQRYAGTSVTPVNDSAVLDRWKFNMSAASKYSVQQVTDAPTGFGYSLKITSSSAYTVGASELFATMQPIEGFNFYDLRFGTASAITVTISFWVKSSLTGTFGGSLSNYAQTRFYPFTYSISSANTWEQKSVTITGDTGGTWVGATNAGAAYLWFSVGAGASISQTAGSWTSSAGYSASGSVSVVGTNAATWQVTGVQLERGTTATPFEYRNFQQELAMCQRYYQKSFAQGTVPQNLVYTISTTIGCHGGSNGWSPHIPFKVTMRASPTMTPYGNSGLWQSYISGVWGNWTTTNIGASDNGIYIDLSGGLSVSTGSSYLLRGDYVAVAEL